MFSCHKKNKNKLFKRRFSQILLQSKYFYISNILFISTLGVGKTHLSVGSVDLGIKAINNKRSTYFIYCHKLIENLKRVHCKGRLSRKLQMYVGYKLLFQLINIRYTKHPTIITSNLTLDKWNKLFDDPIIGIASLDRLLEKSSIININGNSYRTRNLYNEIEGGKTTETMSVFPYKFDVHL